MTQFKSIFAKELQDLIDLKRAIGYKYETEEVSFKRIDDYFCSIQLDKKEISKEVTMGYCTQKSWQTYGFFRLKVAHYRVFCKYLADLGYQVSLPPQMKNPEKYNAYIFSEEEHKRMVHIARHEYNYLRDKNRQYTFPLILELLFTSGFRISELTSLKKKDVLFDKGCFYLKDTKNKKERLVPIHPKLLEECRDLMDRIHKFTPEDEYFFLHSNGKPLTRRQIYSNFLVVLEKANIPRNGHGPRLHDIRHSYMCNLLMKWVEEGQNLLVMLPYLCAMVGHQSLSESAYYLKLITRAHPLINKKLEEAFGQIVEEAELTDEDFY